MQKHPPLTSSIPKNKAWEIHDSPATYFLINYYSLPNKTKPKNVFIAGYLTLRIRNDRLKEHFNGMPTIHAAKAFF